MQDLELAKIEARVADAVGRHLDQILEQRDSPAHQRRDDPRSLAQVFEMRVPRKGHEDIRNHQQDDGLRDDGHAVPLGGGELSAARAAALGRRDFLAFQLRAQCQFDLGIGHCARPRGPRIAQLLGVDM